MYAGPTWQAPVDSERVVYIFEYFYLPTTGAGILSDTARMCKIYLVVY